MVVVCLSEPMIEKDVACEPEIREVRVWVPLLCATWIVVSHQFGGGCSWGLMALLYGRCRCAESSVKTDMIISALTLLASAALPLFASVDGVAAFLHRERLHCVLVLLVSVLVFVFVCLRRSSYDSANTSALSCLSYLSCFFESTNVTQRGLRFVCLHSSFLIERIFFLVILLVSCVVLSVFIGCCVALLYESSQ